MSTTTFFRTQTPQSRTKAEIVANYADAWFRIISKDVRRRGMPAIGFLDLFAGQGRYDDGSESTPLSVLRKAVANHKDRGLIRLAFNEADPVRRVL